MKRLLTTGFAAVLALGLASQAVAGTEKLRGERNLIQRSHNANVTHTGQQQQGSGFFGGSQGHQAHQGQGGAGYGQGYYEDGSFIDAAKNAFVLRDR